MFGSNFETLEHDWLVNIWPAELRFKNALGIDDPDSDVESWAAVPRTYTGLLNWAYVARNPSPQDMTRSLLLLYKTPHVYPGAPSNMLYPVGIRVQGYVEKCNLRGLGNWDGQGPPQSALQSIVLSGGPEHGSIFQEYIKGIDEVKGYIFKCLSQAAPPSPHREELYIARRVFTKVTSANRSAKTVLSPGDDPMMLAHNVARAWRVLSKANVGMYIADDVDPLDSVSVPCEPLTIGEGDFVDVCVGFDIVTRFMRGIPHHQIHLTMEHVLLLKGAGSEDEMAMQPGTVYKCAEAV
ncbi:hypothetical protein B0H11DRAFT_2251286 [Mycena galericulata]|nr:hypothetical protein B0H11DRAFT_2251286 [Mycena galericulata]